MNFYSKAAILCGFLVALSPSMAAARDDGFDPSAYKGKVVYLDFWASWCTPCRQSFPWMSQLQEVYGPRGLVVVAVNVDHDRALAAQFLQRYAPQFKIVYDSEGKIAERYDFKDMPTSILIGRDGKIAYEHAGFYPDQEMQYTAHVESLIKQGSP